MLSFSDVDEDMVFQAIDENTYFSMLPILRCACMGSDRVQCAFRVR